MRFEAIYEGRRKTSQHREPALPAFSRDASRAAPLVAVAASGCKPFLTIERNQEEFAACQKIAEAIGEIDDPEKAYRLLVAARGGKMAERFGILTLDTHCHMRGIWETGAGETDSVMTPKVPTLHAAISDYAATVIIWHLHPAASDYPSDSDIEVTKDFNRAFNEVGILLMDHIILAAGSKKGFYSFLESMPETLELPK